MYTGELNDPVLMHFLIVPVNKSPALQHIPGLAWQPVPPSGMQEPSWVRVKLADRVISMKTIRTNVNALFIGLIRYVYYYRFKFESYR